MNPVEYYLRALKDVLDALPESETTAALEYKTAVLILIDELAKKATGEA